MNWYAVEATCEPGAVEAVEYGLMEAGALGAGGGDGAGGGVGAGGG